MSGRGQTTRRRARDERRRARDEHGFTLIEVMIAAFVLIVGILGLIFGFDSARRLSLASERQTTMAHIAQKEMERLDSEAYSRLEMSSTPTHSSETSNPDFYVSSGSPAEYQFDPSKSEKEKLAVASKACTTSTEEECGAISATPTAWSAGNSSGYIYDFVTWHTDGHCGAGCATSKDYKRLSVVVTVTVPHGNTAITPIRVTSMAANPNAVASGSTTSGNSNPLENPETKCGGLPCTNGIDDGTAQFWILHDSYASAATLETPATANVHSTIAATSSTCSSTNTSSACPMPDLMNTTEPSASTLLNYSTNLGSTSSPVEYAGGRVIKPGVACSGEQSTSQSEENNKAEMWVTGALSAKTKLTGYGGLSLYTQTLNEAVDEGETLCLAIYDVPNSLTNLLKSPPTRIAYASYTPDAWPRELSSIAFTFTFTAYTVAAEHRIGVRIWPSSSSASLAVAYDTSVDKSFLQLNTE